MKMQKQIQTHVYISYLYFHFFLKLLIYANYITFLN